MDETPFSNREIAEKFEDIKEALGRIEAQTTKTNGRVTVLEAKVVAQKTMTTTAVAIFVVLVIPLIVYSFSQATRCADGSCQTVTNNTINK